MLGVCPHPPRRSLASCVISHTVMGDMIAPRTDPMFIMGKSSAVLASVPTLVNVVNVWLFQNSWAMTLSTISRATAGTPFTWAG